MESDDNESAETTSRIITALLKSEKYAHIGIYLGLLIMAFGLAMPLLFGVK